MEQISIVSESPGSGQPPGQGLSELVAEIPGSSVREVVPSLPVDGDYDGRQPHRLGGIWGVQSAQGRWTLEESRLPINVLELWAIRLCLSSWSRRLQGRPIRIQSDNATAVAYVNHQGRTRSSAAASEVAHILRWAERNGSALSAVYIPGIENWQANYLSRQMLDQGE